MIAEGKIFDRIIPFSTGLILSKNDVTVHGFKIQGSRQTRLSKMPPAGQCHASGRGEL